jgi:ribosomal protein L40E
MSDPTLKATVCRQCGTPAAPGESFCRNCGTQLFQPTVAAPVPTVGAQAPTITAPPPAAPPPYQPPVSLPPARKKRSKLMMGCLIIIGLGVAALGAGGAYVWYRTSYTPPVRKAPDIPQRAAGTLTEFPVDTDKSNGVEPGSVQTESLGGATAKSDTSTGTKLPPGITKTSLAKGATSMTSSTYKKIPVGTSVPTGGDIYICVLTAMPGQPGFIDELVTSVKMTTSGQVTSVQVQSPKGATYAGSHIVSSQGNIYVLGKQGSDIIIILYGADPSTKDTVDRLAQNVGNGEGLNDYPQIKDSLWTLPATTPSELTLVEISMMTGAQIESSIGTSGDLPSEMRPFIPDRLTSARYTDASKQEWVAINLQYGSSFQAWRTWLLARGALGLGGGETTTVRDVDGIYLNQEGKRIMLFQKGPYLVFLSGPAGAPVDRFVALGNQIQV